MTDGEVSHDQIARYLSGELFNSKQLWKKAKPVVREIQSDDACIIFDDTILEKEWTDESDIAKHAKDFIAAVKSNRYFVPSLEAKYQGQFHRVDSYELGDKQSVRGYLKGYDKEVLLVRRLFTNKDGSTGMLNLICSDISQSGDYVATIYEKRWRVEEYQQLPLGYKSLKSNAALGKSPTKTITTQINHIFLSIMAVFKLECLKIKHSLNHFAIRAKLLIKANQVAFAEFQRLKGA